MSRSGAVKEVSEAEKDCPRSKKRRISLIKLQVGDYFQFERSKHPFIRRMNESYHKKFSVPFLGVYDRENYVLYPTRLYGPSPLTEFKFNKFYNDEEIAEALTHLINAERVQVQKLTLDSEIFFINLQAYATVETILDFQDYSIYGEIHKPYNGIYEILMQNFDLKEARKRKRKVHYTDQMWRKKRKRLLEN